MTPILSAYAGNDFVDTELRTDLPTGGWPDYTNRQHHSTTAHWLPGLLLPRPTPALAAGLQAGQMRTQCVDLRRVSIGIGVANTALIVHAGLQQWQRCGQVTLRRQCRAEVPARPACAGQVAQLTDDGQVLLEELNRAA